MLRDTYKYKVLRGKAVIWYDVTSDLDRRASEHKARYPDCRVVQVGRRTTRRAALRWKEERESKRRPSEVTR